MCEKPEITLDEIVKAIGFARRTIEKQVKKLQEEIVIRVGSKKWCVESNRKRQIVAIGLLECYGLNSTYYKCIFSF